MRSRTYYSKFARTSFVKQLWVMGLMAFAYFLVMLVPLAVMINNWTDMEQDHLYFTEHYAQFLIQGDGAYVLLVIAAILIAFVQFSYLHSRRQMDFYGSLSIKRETLFSQRLVFGFVDFAVPYTVTLLICLLVGVARRMVSGHLIVYMLESWLYSLLGFLLIYFVTALAILLTGRIWVAMLGCGVLLSGGVLVQALISSAGGVFFDTYYMIEKNMGLSGLSPVYLLYELRDIIFGLEHRSIFINAKAVIFPTILVIVCVLLVILLRFLVRIRPAERAGQSMAFTIPARVIHIVLSVLCGFAIGMFTMSFVYVNVRLWFFMGTIFGSICMYVLIQFIYTLDIRRTFTYKWQIVAVEAVLLILCSIYGFDLLGYDEYLPKQKNVESVAVIYRDDNMYNEFYMDGIYYSGIDFGLENVELPPDDVAYNMLSEVVSKQDIYTKGRYLQGDYDLERIYVRYRLNSGLEVQRVYTLPIKDFKEEFVHFYDQDNYRSVMVPSLWEEDAEYTHLTVYYAGEEHLIYSQDTNENGVQQDVQMFMEAYNRDMKSLDARTFVEKIPVAKLQASVYMDDRITRRELRVYEECRETLALLEQMGYDPFAAVEPEQIAKIVIDDYSYQYEEKIETDIEAGPAAAEVEVPSETIRSYTITDTDQMKKILSCMIDEQYNSVWFGRAQEYHVCVYMGNNDNGYEVCFYGEFLEDQVPIELLEDLEATMVY